MEAAIGSHPWASDIINASNKDQQLCTQSIIDYMEACCFYRDKSLEIATYVISDLVEVNDKNNKVTPRQLAMGLDRKKTHDERNNLNSVYSMYL